MNKTTLWYINTNRLFKELPEEDRKEILPMLKTSNVKKRCFVYNAGERADMLYFLKEGRIKISRLSEDGRELTIDILDPGDIFGELVLAGEEERETSAEALEDSYICAIKREEFENFVTQKPYLSLKITKWIGGKLREIENRFENMIFHDVKTRLVSLLAGLAAKYGSQVDMGTKIKVKLSHQEIANLIGATRETVTLELNNLKRSGDLIMEGKEFILPAPKA